MNELSKIRDDLSYVRDAVTRADQRTSPPSIYLLWGLITIAGMPLFDLSPQYGGAFFAVAGPLGGVLSGYLGYRFSQRVGESSRLAAMQHSLHWTAMMVAILAVAALGGTGAMPMPTVGRVILLIVAFGYFTAGLYLDPWDKWLGLVILACFIGMFFVTGQVWTITGATIGSSLFIAGFLGWKRGR